MSLLQQLKSGTNAQITVMIGAGEIGMRLLSEQDMLDASMAADRLFADAKIPVTFQNVAMYEAEKTTQQIYRACVEPGTGNPVAENITEFRKLLSTSERAALIEAYNEFDQKMSPSPRAMPQDEFDALVFQVKKTPNETVGSISSLSTLRRLCSYLASTPLP